MTNGIISRFMTALMLTGAALLLAPRATADEGMWLFNELPKEHLQQTHGFQPTEAWARHVMLSSVRFNSGGSASFVSSNGLVLTNHHVGADTLAKLSTPENNYHRDGFLARTFSEEIPAPDLELNQLVAIEDVTARVTAAAAPGVSAAEAAAAVRAAMAEIERESLERTGLRSDVITLYGGARYHLYQYKKYTDVRLVWAPEAAVAFFGGDADNFEYPRYCLDVCLFRVYEDGKPARTASFLRLPEEAPAENDLVFVSGNPGRTQRIFTVAALKYQRDVHLPLILDLLRRREILYQQFGLDSPEHERRAQDDLFSVQNSRKALTGRIQGLQDPAVMLQKQADEDALRRRVEQDPSLRKYADAWTVIENVQQRRAEIVRQTGGFTGQLYQIANTLVFMAAEDQKPSPERLREYRDSARESLEQSLFSPAPIYPDLETAVLADSIALFVERRGGDHPLVQAVLAGKSPHARAVELVSGTRLLDVATRRALARGTASAFEASADPMIELARLMEPEARRLRAITEELDELERQAYGQIADAKFALEGTSTYPDATFTLRLSFGTIRGYEEDGRWIPAWTTLDGAFATEQLHGKREPWLLPESWHAARPRLDMTTPVNFVCTADIIGGNSGSPVVNRNAELVGVIFDGNIQSLTANYFYSDEPSRAVAVHIDIMLEALRKVYDAGFLADELGR